MERSTGSIENSGVDLRGLRALVAVADFGSFRAAAGELGYTQSAISHQVAELERALGASLFTRPGGRGAVSLTRAGEAAYLHARRAFSELHALDASVQATLRGERTVVRVGVFQTAAAELLPAALRVLREEWPGVEVVLSETDDDPRLIEWLAAGRLDLALTINQQPDDRVELIRLYEDPWVVLTRRDSPLAGASPASFELLDGADVVGLDVALGDPGRTRGGLAPARHQPSRRLPHRRQPGLATPRRRGAGPRLRRAVGRRARGRSLADLARATRRADAADGGAVPPAPAGSGGGGAGVERGVARAVRAVSGGGD